MLKAAALDKSFHDYLLINYFDKDYGEQDLFEQAKSEINKLFVKNYKGNAPELKMANMLGDCAKRITLFSKVCKSKNLEADLLLHVLDFPFSLNPEIFGTCFTMLNFKITLLLKRLINLVEVKMHEDFKIQYQSKINEYLRVFHQYSSGLDYVASLPKSI